MVMRQYAGWAAEVKGLGRRPQQVRACTAGPAFESLPRRKPRPEEALSGRARPMGFEGRGLSVSIFTRPEVRDFEVSGLG
jgi:hypothetical protein